jgi:hypothetical protein
MVPNEVIQERSLPGPEERRKILERAGLILAEARALVDRLDRADGKVLWVAQANRAVRSLAQLEGSRIPQPQSVVLSTAP